MTKETLKLALEALEDLGMKHYESTGEVLYKETFAAIKEALANDALEKKAENARELGLNYEPVAYVKTVIEALYENSDPVSVEAAELLERITTPPQRKPLTDEEALELWSKHEKHWRFENNALAFARAIEAAHGIKGEA